MWEQAIRKRLEGADAYTAYASQTRSLSFEDAREVLQALDKITDTEFWHKVLEMEKTSGH